MRTALLTAHYGNPFWVQLLLARAREAFPQMCDRDIYVIDQDRAADSAERLRSLVGPVEVLRYPKSERHFAMTGHDHANVLNLAVRSIDADVLILFDSDAHPVHERAAALIERELEANDAVLAAHASAGPFSHPSFMVFGPAVDRESLFFDADLMDRHVDTGRLIYTQLSESGLRAKLLRPTPAFEGMWGTLYLDGSVYHHGSGSFDSNSDAGFVRQVSTWRREDRFVRRRVAERRYTLTRGERRLLQMSFGLRRLHRRADGILMRRAPAVARRLGVVVHPTNRGLE